jgi:hypothetical protein
VLDGSLLQEALLPRWLIPALLAALAGLIALVIIWLTLLQPAINSSVIGALADAGITPKPTQQGGAPKPTQAGGNGQPTQAPASQPGGGTPTPTPGAGSPSAPPSEASSGSPPTPVPTGGVLVPGTPRDGRLAVDGSSPPSTQFDQAYYLTDLVFANPSGRAGTMKLLRDSFVLITLRLENFRDLDYHYVTPIVVQKGQVLALKVTCSSGSCDPSVYFSGFLAP